VRAVVVRALHGQPDELLEELARDGAVGVDVGVRPALADDLGDGRETWVVGAALLAHRCDPSLSWAVLRAVRPRPWFRGASRGTRRPRGRRPRRSWCRRGPRLRSAPSRRAGTPWRSA